MSCHDFNINQILNNLQTLENTNLNSNWNSYCQTNKDQLVNVKIKQVDTRKKKAKTNTKKKKRRISNQKKKVINLHLRLSKKFLNDANKILEQNESKSSSNNTINPSSSIDPDDFSLMIDEIQHKKKEMLALHKKVVTIENYQKTFYKNENNEDDNENEKFRLLKEEINSNLAAYNREEYFLRRLCGNHKEKIALHHHQQHRHPHHASLALDIEKPTEAIDNFISADDLTKHTNDKSKNQSTARQSSLYQSNTAGSLITQTVVQLSETCSISSKQSTVPFERNSSAISPSESAWFKYLREYP